MCGYMYIIIHTNTIYIYYVYVCIYIYMIIYVHRNIFVPVKSLEIYLCVSPRGADWLQGTQLSCTRSGGQVPAWNPGYHPGIKYGN